MSYKFCPQCGGKLVKFRKNAPQCSQCGFIFYQNSAVAFGALIINSRDEILLAKRKYPPQKGKWDLPGGFLDYGENGPQALKRELKEELGIKVREFKLLDTEIANYFYQGRKFKVLNLFYLVNKYQGKIKPQDDVAAVKWFNKNKLPQTNWAFDWICKAIQKWQKT